MPPHGLSPGRRFNNGFLYFGVEGGVTRRGGVKLGSITMGGGGVVVGGLLILKSVEYRSEYGSVGTAFSGFSLGLLFTFFFVVVVL